MPLAVGSGHDVTSVDGEVAAEVFAAVSPTNNDKLKRDVEKVSTFAGSHRYVFLSIAGLSCPRDDDGERAHHLLWFVTVPQ